MFVGHAGAAAARPGRRVSSTFRFLFYLPGALAGAATVLVWLFMLDPSVSPGSFLLHHVLGVGPLRRVDRARQPAVDLRDDRVLDRAGGWIVVMYGALNTIPHELEEAARIDGAGPI